jgi:hypothetical protein
MTARTIRTPADIKGMVEGGKLVNFIHFQGGSLWYATECGFEFPVSLDEVGETTYPAQDKALLFMRFIRKHIQMIQASLGEVSRDQEPRVLAPPPCV